MNKDRVILSEEYKEDIAELDAAIWRIMRLVEKPCTSWKDEELRTYGTTELKIYQVPALIFL